MEIHRKGMEHLNPILKKQLAGKPEQVAPPDVKPRTKAADVRLSKRLLDVQKFMEKYIKDAPEVRQYVVDDLRARIAAGTYQVDSRDLAQAILDNLIIDH